MITARIEARPGERIFSCEGPTPEGWCPHADRDGVVACAGSRVACDEAPPEYWLVWVPPGSHHCPLAWSFEASY